MLNRKLIEESLLQSGLEVTEANVRKRANILEPLQAYVHDRDYGKLTVQAYLDRLIGDGYTNLGVQKKGAVNQTTMVNPETGSFVPVLKRYEPYLREVKGLK